MSKTIRGDQLVKHEVMVNAFESGYLFGRFQTDNWTKISADLPKKDGMYLVTDGRNVMIYRFYVLNKAFKNITLLPSINIKYWQQMPLPPRSEIGRD